jgi:cytochrome c-type biogenesis protein CcmH
MTFWMIATGLMLSALLFLLWPLRRVRAPGSGVSSLEGNVAIIRAQLAELDGERKAGSLSAEDYEKSRTELERRLVEDAGEVVALAPLSRRWPALGLVAVLPAVTVGLYLYLGAPGVLDSQSLLQARGNHDVDAMMVALEKKLAKNPNDAEGWYVLGRSYLELKRIADAEKALAKAAKLAPKEARYLSQYAEVLALGAGGNLQGRPLELINQALELNYEDDKALELAGLAAFQRQDWAQTVHFWRRLLKRLPAESEFHQDISAAIKDAEEKAAKSSGLGEKAKLQPPVKKGNPH